MKEEIEEEFYPGRHNGIQKGKLYRKTALFIPEGERDIGEIHCFIPFRPPVRCVRRTRNGEREKLGKISFIGFSLLRSLYTSKNIR